MMERRIQGTKPSAPNATLIHIEIETAIATTNILTSMITAGIATVIENATAIMTEIAMTTETEIAIADMDTIMEAVTTAIGITAIVMDIVTVIVIMIAVTETEIGAVTTNGTDHMIIESSQIDIWVKIIKLTLTASTRYL